MSLQVVLIITNSADTDEMQHYAAFLHGLHSMPKNPFRDFQYTRLDLKICSLAENDVTDIVFAYFLKEKIFSHLCPCKIGCQLM